MRNIKIVHASTKEKTKISFLPFNLFFCLTTCTTIFVLLYFLGDLSFKTTITISILFYLADVNRNTTEDYLNYKIRQLQEKIKP